MRNQPQVYAGQHVRVTGQLDYCWNMSCGLCPLEATPANPQRERCLAISFDRMRAKPGSWGADMDGAFRYADVTINARFDPACLGPDVVCTDRASVLLAARVEQVHRRRRSRDGIVSRPDPLLPAPEEIASAVLALVEPVKAPWAQKVFTTRSGVADGDSAVVCESGALAGEPVDWPLPWQTALVARSTEDRYTCTSARKLNGRWYLRIR